MSVQLKSSLAVCIIWLCLFSGSTRLPPMEARAASDAIASSIPTADRVQRPGWWPTKGDPPSDAYTGSESCARCHAAITASYRNMAMAHASEPAADSEPLRKHRELTIQFGPYKYSLLTEGSKTLYSVTNGTQTLSQEPEWAFGAGRMGLTFVYQRDGGFYESHLSYYSAIDGLDITTGHDRGVPPDLQHAAGRRIYLPETQRCFGCHTTASVASKKFDPEKLHQGVTCEACHGPGADHVAAEKAGMPEAAGLVFNSGKLDRVDAVDFCGACHRSTADVIDGNFVDIGVMNVRFQPYRLQQSRCWEEGDARLTCTSCHDPHQPVRHQASDYDAACLRCHLTNLGAQPTPEHPGAACKVSTKECTNCHMPKYEIPGSHSSFADHWIRVVRAGEPYPN